MTRSLVDVRLFSSRMGASRWDSDPKGGAETVREKKCNRCIAYSWPDRCCVVIHGYIFSRIIRSVFFVVFFFLPLRRTAFFVYTVSLIPTFLFELRLFMFLLLVVVDLGNLP